jgi:hypothetical protein
MCIIEARCVDEEYASSVQGEVIRELDLGGARSQVRSDSKVGTTACIDELQNACQFARSVGINVLTEVFPLPVAPITLWRHLVQAAISRLVTYAMVMNGLSCCSSWTEIPSG